MATTKKTVQRRANASTAKGAAEKKRGAKTEPASAVSAVRAASAVRAGEEEQRAFERARRSLPEPGEALRKGLAMIHTDAECAALGGETRAADVVPEALRTLMSAVEIVQKHGDKVRFRPTRLRYAMDLASALEAQWYQQREGAKGGRRRASALVLAETEAGAARDALVRAIAPVVGAGGDTEREAFALARGALREKDLLASLEELVALGRSWAGHEDGALAALAEHQGLTEEALAGFTEAARALARARQESAVGGPSRGGDLPKTNVLEGRVLFELKALYDAVEGNRESTVIPLPWIGATTRRALWRSKKSGRRAADDGAPKGGEPKPKK